MVVCLRSSPEQAIEQPAGHARMRTTRLASAPSRPTAHPPATHVGSFIEGLAVPRAHALAYMWDHGDAAVREWRERGNHLDQRDFGGAERDRRVGIELRGDAEAMRGSHHGLRAELE